jgi:HEAT repeat protein
LGYHDAQAREAAEGLILEHLQSRAAPLLLKLLEQPDLDRAIRSAAADTLDSLGFGDKVDWVPLAIEDLTTKSCKTRRAAVARLQELGDARAVGPLMKLADSMECAATQAKKAAETLMEPPPQ